MKFSKKEKRLLILMIILIVGYMYYFFVVQPYIYKKNHLQGQIRKYEQKVYDVKSRLKKETSNESKMKVLNDKIALESKRFFPSINQEKIIIVLDDIIKKSNLVCNVINFTNVELKSIDKKHEDKDLNENSENEEEGFEELVEEYKNEREKNINEDKQKSKQLYNMRVTLDYEGKYEDLLKFMNIVSSYQNKIIIHKLDINKKSDSVYIEDASLLDNVSGDIVLDFYAIYKLYEEDSAYLKWDFKGPYGKENPFAVFNGYTKISELKDEIK